MKYNSTVKIRWMKKIALLLIVVAIIIFGIIIISMFRGNTTIVSGHTEEDSKNNSLSCSADNFDYPFFTYNNAVKSTTTVNIIFNEDEVRTISLLQKMSYEEPGQSNASEAVNHAAMNKSFGGTLGSDALNARYMVDDTSMNMSLFLDSKSLFDTAKKYFLIQDNLSGIDEYKTNYEKQGFNCKER